jgi:hypothetical protein
VLLRGGREVAESASDELSAAAAVPGAYRVEIHAAGAPGTPDVPWLVSNPIYLRGQAQDRRPVPREYSVVSGIGGTPAIEKDPASTGTVTAVGGGFAVEYTLKSGDRASQFVAASLPMPPGSDAAGLRFESRSSAPMRVSVQLRFDDQSKSRWARSVYVSPEGHQVVMPFSELVRADGATSPPPFTSASSILFVVDLTNAQPGQSGSFEVRALSLVK